MKVRTEWAYNLERTIFSIVKARAENSLKNKYPKIRFTNEEEADGNAIFPTVLIQSVQPLEKVADLEKINIEIEDEMPIDDVEYGYLSDDTTKDYIGWISRYPLLTKEEEIYYSLLNIFYLFLQKNFF